MNLANEPWTRPSVWARTILALTVAVAFLWIPDWALADVTPTADGFVVSGDDFYLPRPITASDQENVRRTIASHPVPAEYVGQTCRIVQTIADNGDSVHLNNYAVLQSNGDEVLVTETESAPNVVTVRQPDRTIILGDTFTIYNVMVRDDDDRIGTSVTIQTTVDCTQTPEPTTTTTTPDDTTTTVPGSTTSTTVPPSSTTTVTVPPTTDVECCFTPSTLIVTSTTTVPPVTGSTLPFTGPADHLAALGGSAAAAMGLGGFLLHAARKRGAHEA